MDMRPGHGFLESLKSRGDVPGGHFITLVSGLIAGLLAILVAILAALETFLIAK